MKMLYLPLTTNLFAAFLLLILICFDCSLSDSTSSNGALKKPLESMNGRIHNRNLLHIDSSTQFTSAERDSPSTVSSPSKHPSQNSNISFDENDNSGSSSSVPPTFKLSDDEIEQVSGAEENRTAELFNCSEISLNVTDQDDIQMKNFKLKIKHQSGPGVTFTVCSTEKEEKVTQTYLPALGMTFSIFTYEFVSLFCACIFIISVSKFFMLYIVLNIITYFLIYMMLTGSTTEVIIYFLPFHLNFMFILVTGWITIMSSKSSQLVCLLTNFFCIASSNVVGNGFSIFQLTMVISLFQSLPDLVANRKITSFMLSNADILDQEEYFKLMGRLTPSIVSFFIFFFITYFLRALTVTHCHFHSDLGFQHTDHYGRYLYYYLFSLFSWLFGYSVIDLHSAFPQFWHLYLFVTVLLPLSFLIDSIITNRSYVSF